MLLSPFGFGFAIVGSCYLLASFARPALAAAAFVGMVAAVAALFVAANWAALSPLLGHWSGRARRDVS